MIWTPKKVSKTKAKALAKKLNDLPLPLARVLVGRGIDTFDKAKTFFRGEADQIHDPMLLKGMEEACARLFEADRLEQRVVFCVDYDCDGTSSGAILHKAFHSIFGDRMMVFVPNRYEHGYGLSRKAIKAFWKFKPDLIVTADCGITSVEEVAGLKSVGVDVIITDHHLPKEELPDCIIINPNQPGCEYPNKGLCGAAVAYKLVAGLRGNTINHDPLLQLVAIATIADVMPMTPENRALIRAGFNAIGDLPTMGVLNLMDVSGVNPATISSRDVGWDIGPRINAAGRMGRADKVFDLLTTADQEKSKELAEWLDATNKKRKVVSNQVFDEALLQTSEQDAGSGFVCVGPWPGGIVGLAAGRIANQYQEPTILLSDKGDILKGSARSINGFHLLEALEGCADLLETFGGHAAAAGLSLKKENLEAFRDRFNGLVTAAELPDPAIEYDAELPLDLVDKRFVSVLEQMDPFGPQNPTPVWASFGVKPTKIGTLSDGKHLKLEVNGHRAIGFGFGFLADSLKRKRADILFEIARDNWRGNGAIQLKLEDIRPAA